MTSSSRPKNLSSLCRVLRLPAVAREAQRLAQQCTRQKRSVLDFLCELLEIEAEERAERRAKRLLREAGFPILKTLSSFDFSLAPQLPETKILELSQCQYLERAEPILFLGEPGTGKTHLSTALAAEATQRGHTVRFRTAAQLATELIEARDSRELSRIVDRYVRVKLLVVDELGYLPLSQTDAELLFRVLGERHERRATIVTTNLPFSEWTSVFPDPRLCRALVDRLTHRAHIIETGSESVRLRETLEDLKKRGGSEKKATN